MLENGYTATDDLWQWRKNIEDGVVDRRSGTVIVEVYQHGEIGTVRYNFYEGWPAKWHAPEMTSDQSAMAIEKIEVAVEKVERVMQ